MDSSIFKYFGHSLYLVILFYGSAKLINEVLFCACLPLGIVLAISITSFIYYIRVPSANEEVVEAILGKDLQYVHAGEADQVLKVVAHRGAGFDAPENTLAAYKNCKERGCDFIELDVCLTADGVPVIFHDRSTGRLSHDDLEIAKTNWKDLQKVNLSDKHPNKDRFPRTSIPTLEEAVSQLLAQGQKMFIDVKYKDPKLLDAVLAIFEKHPELYTRAIVTSFYASMIYRIRSRNHRIVGAVAWCPYVIYYASKASKDGPLWLKTLLHIFDIIHAWLLPRVTYFLTGFSAILLHRNSLDVKSIWEWKKQKGIRVLAWTVNNPIEKKYCLEVLKIPYLTDTLDDNDSGSHAAQLETELNYLSY